MGGGSGQTNAPCGDIYARECVVAVHHNNNLCCVDFRFFGDELDYIPLKATYPAHERGYLKTILVYQRSCFSLCHRTDML
ncbi:unnamed protein product [Triticum turgidum subsp. durum]|uniref:Uncharacterized protein n=1 Tax=Triticum turgidum subsp. durum TaxID=4567 RepID=A0A9R0ZF48_TRITD|nr:unnamed protein product [Triticum turgidum subsp. durum]